MVKNSLFYFVYVFSFSILLVSCAQYNASFLKQGYHDLTARYNSNFNAKEKYKLSIKAIEDARKENFDTIIPLYAYGTLDDTKTKSADFDIVIDKASRSVQLHKISNWSDDNFLLLGKSFYMQGNYDKAIESFRYITANYPNGVDGRSEKKIKKQRNSKSRKAKLKKQEERNIKLQKEGKDIRPKNGFLKHSPAKSEALVWLAKSFTQNNQLVEAQAVLDYIALENTFIQNYDRDKELAHAEFLLKQNLHSEAISHIEKALPLYKSNKKKARYHYVLAQLYQKLGNNSKALFYYDEATRKNSNYDMVFNAELNKLKLSSDNKNTEKEDKLLSKLIKDSKNEDYLDQLYYERAVIAQKNKDIASAKEFLALSIEKSSQNTNQKVKSYLLLADIYYNEIDYLPAQTNYAECLKIIKPTHSEYKKVTKRANVLGTLVEQLAVIEKNDSLIELAKLPTNKLEALLYDKAVANIEAEKTSNNTTKITDQFAANDVKTNDNKWYFYSDNAKSVGFAKFKKIWGERLLEDDWRRTNKSASSNSDLVIKTEDEIFDEKVNTLYEYLLNEIPKTDSAKLATQGNTIAAHYTSANIYKYDLENENKAKYHFEELINTFPNSKYDAESYYNLYLLNKTENITLANKYKNTLIAKYPDSKFSKLIENPNYLETIAKENLAVDEYYTETYLSYLKDDFETVIQRSNASKTLYPNNDLAAKFALLEAITLGKQTKYQPYVDALEAVVKNYANTDEQAKASEMLAYLRNELPIKEAKPSNSNETVLPTKENTSIFDENKDKDKEGLKVNFGKKEIIKIGTNDEAEKSKTSDKTEPTLKKN